jgi:hypothetical protein
MVWESLVVIVDDLNLRGARRPLPRQLSASVRLSVPAVTAANSAFTSKRATKRRTTISANWPRLSRPDGAGSRRFGHCDCRTHTATSGPNCMQRQSDRGSASQAQVSGAYPVRRVTRDHLTTETDKPRCIRRHSQRDRRAQVRRSIPKPPIGTECAVDTLVLARRKHPGGHNTTRSELPQDRPAA